MSIFSARLVLARSCVALLLLVGSNLLFANVANAGILITERLDETTRSHLYADGVYYQFTDNALDASFNIKTNQCLSVNHESKAYYVGSCDDMYKESLELITNLYKAYLNDKTRSEMQRQIEEAALKAIAEMNKVVITQASLGTEKHLGHSADRFELRYEGKPIKEVWVSPALQELVQKEFDLSRFQKQMTLYNDNLKKAMPFDADDPISRAMVQLEAKGVLLKELPVSGAESFYPMAFTGALSLSNNREVISINTNFKPAKASSLSAPAKYTKSASWQDFLQLQMDENE